MLLNKTWNFRQLIKISNKKLNTKFLAHAMSEWIIEINRILPAHVTFHITTPRNSNPIIIRIYIF